MDKRAWGLVMILGLALLAAALVTARAAGGERSAAVEVVYDQPLFASHMRAGSPVRAAAAKGDSGGQPVASLEERFHNFGRIGAREVVQHDFLLVNTGSAPLVVGQAYTTCACTTAELSATIIPPGKASRVTLIFDAGVHPVSGQTVRRGLVLSTNDPDHAQLEVWVQARVR